MDHRSYAFAGGHSELASDLTNVDPAPILERGGRFHVVSVRPGANSYASNR